MTANLESISHHDTAATGSAITHPQTTNNSHLALPLPSPRGDASNNPLRTDSPSPPPPESTLRRRWNAITKILLFQYKIPIIDDDPDPNPPPPRPPFTPQQITRWYILATPLYWMHLSFIFAFPWFLLHLDSHGNTAIVLRSSWRIIFFSVTRGTLLDLVLLTIWYLTGWQVWGLRWVRRRMALWKDSEDLVGREEVERIVREVYRPLGRLLEDLLMGWMGNPGRRDTGHEVGGKGEKERG
ncbi:hypothetical protein QBC40DRAFT_349530 [Triangularia verruculosa]|uniref:Uncharacterized protein n=1 Tax=Triangularia verruculosa TaxID=2587418 RepID=A0AAN7AU27_9PEZI|nr:hypothetical protein QBC40DRAFT_349530 [Triangularia verruculosa]